MATAKQIAARKKFSEMAKSGKLAQLRKKAAKKNPANTVSKEVSAQMRKGKPQKQAVAIALDMQRQGKLKKNPITETLIYGLAPGETRDYMEELLYGGGLKLTDAQINQVLKAATDAGYHSFRIAGFDPTIRPDFTKAIATKSKRKRNPTPGQRTRSRTKLIQNGNGKRKSNPMQAYAIKCSRSGRTLGYADSLPMAKSMATAIANERMIPVQIVKA